MENIEKREQKRALYTTPKFKIKGISGEEYEITPHLSLVETRDFMNKIMHNIGIDFTYMGDGYEQPFATFTANFGEFIGMKNCAYIDTNNCWFADEILKTGIASDTGLTKANGFCTYPLWSFKPEFLESVNKEIYQQYSDEYEKYMKNAFGGEEQEQAEYEQDEDRIGREIVEYLESDDFSIDSAIEIRQYQEEGKGTPSREYIEKILTQRKREQIEKEIECGKEGHHWNETGADPENGTSDMECQNCGMTGYIQW